MSARIGQRLRAIVPLLGAFLAVAIAAPAPASAAIRAMIVASNYENAADPDVALLNPLADALILEKAFERTAVDAVTVLRDPDFAAWEAGFAAYVDSLAEDDIALFYFAGHGFQVNGVNYLLTGDGRSLVSLDAILRQLTGSARGAIVVIDACRSNPFAAGGSDSNLREVELMGPTRSLVALSVDDLSGAATGLAQVGDLRGLSAVVFFSTEPGNVAEDGETPGLGSPFAKVFADEVARRQSLDEAFRRTAVAVNAGTDGRQSPWRQGDLPFNVFLAGMRSLPIP